MDFTQRQQARIRRYQNAHRGLNFLRVGLPPTTYRRVNIIGRNGHVFRGQVQEVPLDQLPNGVEVKSEQELYEEIRDMQFPEVSQEPVSSGRRIGGSHTKANKQLCFAPIAVKYPEDNQKTEALLLGADGHVYRGTAKPSSVSELDRKLQGARRNAKSRSPKGAIREAVVPTVVSLYVDGQPDIKVKRQSLPWIEIPVPSFNRMIEVARKEEMRAHKKKLRQTQKYWEEDGSDTEENKSDSKDSTDTSKDTEEKALDSQDSKETRKNVKEKVPDYQDSTESNKDIKEKALDSQVSTEISKDTDENPPDSQDSTVTSEDTEEKTVDLRDSKEDSPGFLGNTAEKTSDLQDSGNESGSESFEVFADSHHLENDALSSTDTEELSDSQDSGSKSSEKLSTHQQLEHDSPDSEDLHSSQDFQNIPDSQKVTDAEKADNTVGFNDSVFHESNNENVLQNSNKVSIVQKSADDNNYSQDSYDHTSENTEKANDTHESDQEGLQHHEKETTYLNDSKNIPDSEVNSQNKENTSGLKDSGIQNLDQEYVAQETDKETPASQEFIKPKQSETVSENADKVSGSQDATKNNSDDLNEESSDVSKHKE